MTLPVRRRLLQWLAIASISLVVAAAGARWLQSRGTETQLSEALAPEERALREAAARTPDRSDPHRELGAYLLQHGRYHGAIWSFQEALERKAGDVEAHLGLARGLIGARLPRLALTVLADGVSGSSGSSADRASGTHDVEKRRVAAEAYLAVGDPVGAVGVLSGSRAKTDMEALLLVGAAHDALGDDLNAASTYRRLLDQDPRHVDGLLAAARLALKRGDGLTAAELLARARREAPKDPRAQHLVGDALRLQGPQAVESKAPGHVMALYQQVATAHPEFGPTQLELGLMYARQGRPEAATRLLERAVSLGAGGAEVRLRLADALERSGQPAKARYQRGLYYMATQQPARAVREFEQMDRLDPARPDALLMLSSAYSKMYQNGRAATVAGQALERFPGDRRVMARRAQALIMADDRPAARDLCRRWIEQQPDAAEPYRLLGSIARAELRHTEAVRLYERAVERDPRNADYCREFAQACLGEPTEQNLNRAADLLRRAVRLAPDDPDARFLLGDVLLRLEDPRSAREQYLRGLDLNPGDRRGALGLSQVCSRLGKTPAVTFYGQIVRVLQEREDSARGLWRRVFQQPDDAEAHSDLARLLMEAGDLEQARHQLAQAVALQPGRKAERRHLEIVERLLELRRLTPMAAQRSVDP